MNQKSSPSSHPVCLRSVFAGDPSSTSASFVCFSRRERADEGSAPVFESLGGGGVNLSAVIGSISLANCLLAEHEADLALFKCECQLFSQIQMPARSRL